MVKKANVAMKWTPKHDLELVKEMLAERPFDYPNGSREIGAVWKKNHVKFKLENRNKLHIKHNSSCEGPLSTVGDEI